MRLSPLADFNATSNSLHELQKMRAAKPNPNDKQLQAAQNVQAAESARSVIAQVGAELGPVSGGLSSGSSMQGNFVDKNREQSKYVQHATAGQKAEKHLGDRMNSLVAVISSEIAYAVAAVEARGSKTGAGGIAYAVALKSKRKVTDLIQDEVCEKSKKHLKETRDDIEKKAQEAMAPAETQDTPTEAQAGEAAPVITIDGGINIIA